MATRAQKVRLAVFLVFSFSVLAGFLLVVAGAQLLRQRVAYKIEFEESVGGLTPGDPVKYQGVTVGRVEDLGVSAEHLGVIVVAISLEASKVPNVIRQDTQARLYSQGVTGLKYIELIAGAEDSPILPPGNTLPAKATFLANMEERADQLTRRVEALLVNLAALTAEPNQQKLGRLLTAGSDLMENASGLLAHNRGDLDATVANLAIVTDNLAATTASLRAMMNALHTLMAADETRTTLRDLHVATASVRELLDGPLPELVANVNKMVGNVDGTVTHVDLTVLQSRKNILDAMQNLEETLLNIRQVTELVREDPSVLIRGRSEP